MGDSLLGGSDDGPKQRQYEGDRYNQDYQVGAERAAQLSGAPGAVARVEAQTNAGKSAGDYSIEQGQSLLAGETTRSDAPVPDANYLAYTPQQQYDMVHNGLDAGTIDARGQAANAIGNWLSQVHEQAMKATQNEQAHWQGKAAEKAHGFIGAAATWADTTAQASWLSSNRMSQQAAAATNAKNSMPEPNNFDQNAAMTKASAQIVAGDLVDGLQTQRDIGQQQAAAQQQHEQGAQVLHQLDATYHDTASTQPAFTPPPTMAAQSGSDEHTSASSFISSPGPGPGAGPGNSGGQFTGGPVGGGAVVPGPVNGPGGDGGFTPAPGRTTGSTEFPTPGVGGGSLSGGSLGATPRPGFNADAMGGAFGGGTGSGSGGDIERTGRSYGPGANAAGGRMSGLASGKESGGKIGGAPEEGRVAPGAQTAANKAGAPGQPGVNAGNKGKKEEDEERKAKYLLAEDPLDIDFGEGPNGERVVPPVIGE
jgi:uncharacterized protein YdbL (DUF1318 family)